MQALPQIRFSVSATTRPPRGEERDGVAYHFLTPDAFRAAVAAGDLLEYEEVYPDRFYGTLRSEVERSSVAHPVLLDVDVVGALNVKREFGDQCLAVFVQAPSMEELEHRLRSRGTDDEATIATRLDKAAWEMSFAPEFDVRVVNDDLDRAADELIAHVRTFLGTAS